MQSGPEKRWIIFFAIHIFQTQYRVKVNLLKESNFEVKFFKKNYLGHQF
jgi:hypothetical protein